jgi:ATP-dependent DNA helicase Rep
VSHSNTSTSPFENQHGLAYGTDSGLNPQQLDAVRHLDGPLLVLAGAGSGKTRVITEKIRYLITRCDMPAGGISAVTFTNKAAREMKQRLTSLVGDKGSEVAVSTFHRLGLNIIRAEHHHLGLKRTFSLFDQQDSLNLIRDLARDNNLDSNFAEQIQSLISRWKNDFIDPGQALAMAASGGEQAMASIYDRYLSALQTYNALDLDDLIYRPVKLLQSNPDVLRTWQQKTRYLLVDEYQDTNNSQYELVRLLTGDKNGLTVVGDDDQSIYTWRGARPENLARLQEDFPSLSIIKLEQNYRSSQRILKSANRLIANNTHVFDKKLWSNLGYGEPIRVIELADEEEECERIAIDIHNQRLRHKLKYRDFAILYRGNHQSRLLEIKLQQHQIPYQVSGGQSFFERSEVRDIMAYLRLLVNPDDDNAFIRIINTPRRGLGTTALEHLATFSRQCKLSLNQCCENIDLENHVKPAAASRFRQFSLWMDQCRRNCYRIDPMAVVREMLDDIGYRSWLEQTSNTPESAERRWDNVNFLLESLAREIPQPETDESSGTENPLEQAITRLILQDVLDQQQEEKQQNSVQLMTLHAAKGLEFPHVYLMGMEEELLPHRTSIEEDNLEEERRLAYVGVTRAQQKLTLTLAANRTLFGKSEIRKPSRFIDELPQEDIEYEGFQAPMSEEANREKASSTLNSLKSMFNDEPDK